MYAIRPYGLPAGLRLFRVLSLASPEEAALIGVGGATADDDEQLFEGGQGGEEECNAQDCRRYGAAPDDAHE